MRIIRILMEAELVSQVLVYLNHLTWLSAQEDVTETLEILAKALKPMLFLSLGRRSQKFT
jgi:hypothetical protein